MMFTTEYTDASAFPEAFQNWFFHVYQPELFFYLGTFQPFFLTKKNTSKVEGLLIAIQPPQPFFQLLCVSQIPRSLSVISPEPMLFSKFIRGIIHRFPRQVFPPCRITMIISSKQFDFISWYALSAKIRSCARFVAETQRGAKPHCTASVKSVNMGRLMRIRAPRGILQRAMMLRPFPGIFETVNKFMAAI